MMKKTFAIIASLLIAVSSFAQSSKLFRTIEIVSIEDEGEVILQVVNIPEDGANHYYLDLGSMGIGNKIIQINVDPVNRLYIPLGENLTDAIAKIEEIRDICKQPKGTSVQIDATFSPILPGKNIEPVTVTRYKAAIFPKLEFMIEKESHVRTTYVTKQQLSSILNSVKFYKKLHPNE